jgi:hypothetical protein
VKLFEVVISMRGHGFKVTHGGLLQQPIHQSVQK